MVLTAAFEPGFGRQHLALAPFNGTANNFFGGAGDNLRVIYHSAMSFTALTRLLLRGKRHRQFISRPQRANYFYNNTLYNLYSGHVAAPTEAKNNLYLNMSSGSAGSFSATTTTTFTILAVPRKPTALSFPPAGILSPV